MRFRTFSIGVALALAVLLFGQQRSLSAADAGSFQRRFDLTRSFAGWAGMGSPASWETRIEAPARLVPGFWTVDQIPQERLRVPLVVIDLSQALAADATRQLTVADIARYENARGEIPAGALVTVHTGWHPLAPGRVQPFSEEAVHFLVEGRLAVGLGSDAPRTLDSPRRPSALSLYIAQHSVYRLDNMDLNSVSAARGQIVVRPLPYAGALQRQAQVQAQVL
jgi:kynurenine formamidase